MPNKLNANTSRKHIKREVLNEIQNPLSNTKDNKIIKIAHTSIIENLGFESRTVFDCATKSHKVKLPIELDKNLAVYVTLRKDLFGEYGYPYSFNEILKVWLPNIDNCLRKKLNSKETVLEFIHDLYIRWTKEQDETVSKSEIADKYSSTALGNKWIPEKMEDSRGVAGRKIINDATYELLWCSGFRMNFLTEGMRTTGICPIFVSKGKNPKFNTNKFVQYINQIELVKRLPISSNLRQFDVNIMNFKN